MALHFTGRHLTIRAKRLITVHITKQNYLITLITPGTEFLMISQLCHAGC